MTDMPLDEAIAEVKAYMPPPLFDISNKPGDMKTADAFMQVYRAVASGDLIPKTEVQALIAAAVMEAAGAAKKRADELRAFSPEGFGPIGGVIGVAVGIETAIRALITPDAMAALEAYRDREVVKAVEAVLDEVGYSLDDLSPACRAMIPQAGP